MASKIVVIGNVNCELQDVFTKLAKLQVKQSFSFAIIAGDLFGNCSTEHELQQMTALLQGSIIVPLPTYFTLGSKPLPTRVIEQIEANDEVCPNLYFLGKRGTLKTSEGIRIVALGGSLEEVSPSTDKYHPGYTESDARTLIGAHHADILLTHQWPKGVRTGSKVQSPEDATPTQEIQCIADLCSALKPRYHLSSTDGFFFEREPFFHLPTEDNPDEKPLTRFISLASYSKTSKQKWMYAFTLDPKAPHPITIPVGATVTPFSPLPTKRKPLPDQNSSYSRFAPVDNDSHHHKRSRKHQHPRAPPPGPDQCFFCLSNPNIATHLITSIGNEAYLTIAKGPLPTSKTFSPSLPFPGHMLIIPFNHTPALNSITDTPSRHSTYAEMQKYRAALHSMLHARSNGSLGAVTWEVSRTTGIHIHWQFLPVPANLVTRGLVEAAFKVEAENLKYPKFETLSSSAQSDPSAEPGDFFRVWIWAPPAAAAEEGSSNSSGDSATEKTILLPLGPDFRFDLQFGRRVMAKLMELEKRINWKDDVQSREEEEVDAAAFKEAFKGFDFTLEE
ncbi:CwfJ C-terminus 2-domain-containing protein-like protein [Aspergillus cavernicola]|uniref:CwfJ C-terminus 2-domain-containing protein-like protein n=1 Tax=Aspergillus cavernicola TaxID=176166 RepID=A0ABR4IIU6_9EURO